MRGNCLGGLALFFLVFPSPIDAAQNPKPPSASQPGETNHSQNDLYSKEPYVYELIESHVRFEANGKGQRDLVVRVRIQSESAVREFGLMVYPFASSFESLDALYVRVRKPDGTVLETPASDIQELDSAVSREAPMYTDEREKHIAVKSLSVGDILEAHLRWTIHDPMAPGHFWFDDSYFRAGICLQETLQIDVPANLPVKLLNSDPQPTIREEEGRRLYTFKSSNLKKPEDSKIPDWEKNFHGAPPPDVQLTSFSSWEEVGKWFGSLEQTKAAVTPEIRAKAEELTKGKNYEEEKVHAIYDFVSTRFRYIAVDLGLSRFTPHAASDVLVNRYGDCKDKHTLFAALLQAVGITSYPVLISSKYRLDASFPTMSLFDHVITAIPRGESFLFLDTTPEVAPYGFLIQNIRDRQALVIPTTSAARLVTTPADPPFPSYERFRIDSSIDVHGTLDAKMRLEDRGDGELALRLAYRSMPQNRWQELTQNIAARLGFGGTVSDVTVAQPEDTEKAFWIDFSYHRTDYPDWKNHRVILPSPPIFLASLNEEQKLSKEPLPLGALEDITYDASMKFPQGYTPLAPEKVEQKSDFAEFTATYSLEQGLLRGIFHLKTLLHEVPGTERSQFSSLFNNMDETARRYVFVSGDFPAADATGAQLLALLPSRPEDAIPVLEKNLAEDPDKKLTLLLLSQAYCKTHRSKDAISILEKALARNPVDPQDLYAALGHAYLAVPDGDKAIIQFQKALGDKPEPARLNDAASGLADANVRLEDALSYSKRAVSSLAAQTIDISSDDAEPSDFALMPQLAANWDTLGWIKFRMGDAATAEKYLEAAWQLKQAPAIGEHLVEVYEKLEKKRKAAAVCNMAEAAVGSTVTPLDAPAREKITEEMKRLRPFLTSAGTSASTKTRSNPPDAHAALADMRSMNIPLATKLKSESGKANFVISLINGPKVDNVVFVSGTEDLRNAIAALAAAKYAQSFPDDTPVRILRKASLNCSVYSKDCLLFMNTVEEASGTSPVNISVRTAENKQAKQPLSKSSPTDNKPAEARDSPAKSLIAAAKRATGNGDYATSAQLYEQAIAIDPNHKEAWNDLGFAYGKLGQYEKEEGALRKALSLDPAARWAHYNLGNALMAQKKYDEAISEYQKEIETKSYNSLVRLNLGRVYVLTGKFEKAVPELEIAATLMPDNPAVQFNLGLAFAKTGQLEKASQALNRSVELEPTAERKNSVAYEMALDRLQLDQAQKYVESAIEHAAGQTKDISLDRLTNEDVRVPAALGAYWDTLGWVKFQQGKILEAEKYARSAWQIRSIGEIGDHLGQIYEKEGRKAEAVEMYSIALATAQPMAETKPRLAALLGSSAEIDTLTEKARAKLAQSYAIKIKNTHRTEGIAEFWVLLMPGAKVSAAKFIPGDETLRPFTGDLGAATLPDSFPDATEIKLLRRGKLTCLRSSEACSFVFVSAETIRSAN